MKFEDSNPRNGNLRIIKLHSSELSLYVWLKLALPTIKGSTLSRVEYL